MDSSPQSDIVDVLDVHDTNMETLALPAAEQNVEEEAAAEGEKDSTHPEIIIVSDDESPTEEGGEEISQPQVNQRRVVRRRWTISEDCTLVRLVCVRRFLIWKWIADEIPGRSSNSCRLRWQKLMNYEDQYTKFRWSRLARFLPVTVTREYVFDHWRRHVRTYRSYRLSETAFVDHPVATNLSVQNVQNNEGIVNSAQIVVPTITYPIPGQGSEVITSGDKNVVGNTSMALATTSSNLPFAGASLDLNLNLSLVPQTSSITFYDFLGGKSS